MFGFPFAMETEAGSVQLAHGLGETVIIPRTVIVRGVTVDDNLNLGSFLPGEIFVQFQESIKISYAPALIDH